MRHILLLLTIITYLSIGYAKISPSTWDSTAQEICQSITQSEQLYRNGNIAQAHLAANMAYFKQYDTQMEAAVRTTIGSKHTFLVEQQFHQLSKLMVENPNQQQFTDVKKASTKLCQQLIEDAKVLADANVPQHVFKLNG